MSESELKSAAGTGPVRILGIDPGSRITGFGVIDVLGAKTVHVANGCIRTTGEDFAGRLHEIFTGVADLVVRYQPDEAAIEQVFVAHNVDSAIKLGQARGAALCGTFNSGGLAVHEYAARQVKQSVVGSGGADKTQVQMMIRMLLGLPKTPQADAADALAIALCHAHMRNTMAAIGSASDAFGAGGRTGGSRRGSRRRRHV